MNELITQLHWYRRAFAVVEADTAQALFRLTSDAASLEVFPFHFELDVRYALKDGLVPAGEKPVTVLSGMPINGDHPMHPFTIDADGNLFVSMGSATNTCEVKNRMPHSPGNDPCTELETRAGIWRYDANKTDQVFSPKERYQV